MISALSGSSNAAALLSMFQRKSGTTATPAPVSTSPPAPPPLPPPSSNGADPQSMFAAILSSFGSSGAAGGDSDGDSDGSTAATGSAQAATSGGSAADLLTKLVSAIDTNGDGQLTPDEITSAAAKLQSASGATGGASPSDADNDGDGSSAGAAATGGKGNASQSAYEALFNAVSTLTQNTGAATSQNNVAQKFLSAISVTA